MTLKNGVAPRVANNETGVIQPVAEAARLAKSINPACAFHTDATQAIGRILVDLTVELARVDFLSLSAHKFHGPKGIGALFIRAGQRLDPLMHGGNQQNGMRAGTENPALAAGLAEAIKCFGGNGGIFERSQRMRTLRDQIENELTRRNPGINVLAANASRLPNTSLLLFPDTEGELLVHQLLKAGIASSTGSACTQGNDHPSHVVLAMGIHYADARNVLRLSLSSETNATDIEACLNALAKCSPNGGEAPC
jgi:cysteine desulfurase